jgi:O-antigen ligase
MDDQFIRLERPRIIGLFCFVGLLCTTLIDANAFVFRVTGIHEATSPLILLFCITLTIIFQFKFRDASGAPGMAFALLMGYYLIACSLIRLSDPSSTNVFHTMYYFRQNATAPIVLFCAALGTRHLFVTYPTQKAMFIILAIATVPIAAIFLEFAFGGMIFDATSKNVQEQRAAGFFENPNSAGFSTVATAALGFGCLTLGRHRMLVLGVILGCGMACILTFSRSALVGLFLVAAVQVVVSPIFKQKSLIFLIAIVGVAIAWFVFVGAQQFLDLKKGNAQRLTSLVQIISGDVNEENTGHRFVVARNGLRFWMESPVFGHGIGFGDGRDPDYAEYGGIGPHNQFVFTLMEGGLPLFLFYVVFILSLAFAGWKCKVPAIRVVVLSYSVALVANSLVAHVLFRNKAQLAVMGICLGMLAAANQMGKVRKKMQRRSMAGMAGMADNRPGAVVSVP